jgi:hypothetical protein
LEEFVETKPLNEPSRALSHTTRRREFTVASAVEPNSLGLFRSCTSFFFFFFCFFKSKKLVGYSSPSLFLFLLLKSSETKYDSGSGWPSFWKPIDVENVKEEPDHSHGMYRIEILCAKVLLFRFVLFFSFCKDFLTFPFFLLQSVIHISGTFSRMDHSQQDCDIA